MAKRTGSVLPYNSQAVNAAKAWGGKKREYRIDGQRGLVLVCHTSNVATYLYRYSVGGRGRQKFRSIKLGLRGDPLRGTGISLEQAADRATDYRRIVNNSRDPIAEKKAAEVAKSRAKTFAKLFEERLTSDTRIKESTKRHYRETMNGGDPSPMSIIGGTPIAEITGMDIVAVLDAVEGRGAAVLADQVKAAISSTFRWAMQRQTIAINPAAGLAKRSRSMPRKRVASDDELRAIWRATESDEKSIYLSKSMEHIIRLGILSGQRREEIAGARVDELDLARDTWTIPGDTIERGRTAVRKEGRTKNREEQVVYLSRQATEIWREALAGARNGYVFPARLSVVKIGTEPMHPHIAPHSVSTAVRRLRMELEIKDITLHDQRRTMTTWAGNNNVSKELMDRLLNHKPQDVTTVHYDHSDRALALRDVWQRWADHVWQVVGLAPAPTSNVVRLRTGN